MALFAYFTINEITVYLQGDNVLDEVRVARAAVSVLHALLAERGLSAELVSLQQYAPSRTAKIANMTVQVDAQRQRVDSNLDFMHEEAFATGVSGVRRQVCIGFFL